jgi:hypothetical protein
MQNTANSLSSQVAHDPINDPCFTLPLFYHLNLSHLSTLSSQTTSFLPEVEELSNHSPPISVF